MTSPKQPQPERQRDWYPYYAGFTEEFVSEILREYVAKDAAVLDPWNGSGTTTSACANRGLSSAGVDISPALTVIARARLVPRPVAESLPPLGEAIMEAAQRHTVDIAEEDMLEVWFHRNAVRRLRAIQSAIHSVISNVPNPPQSLNIVTAADRLPLLACFYYCALFSTTRDLLSRFRATNPTWLKDPQTSRHRISPSWKTMCEHFVRRTEFLAQRLTIERHESVATPVSVRTASAAELPFASETFAACVTSPPYATRIDYVKSVLPELAVLGATRADVKRLRQISMGSPVVKGVVADNAKLNSRYGRSILKKIGAHPSKGSRRYYLPWMSNYLKSLQRGLQEVARVVADDGAVCVVVQDSHYKEFHIDLQRVVVETMTSAGRSLASRSDYEARHHRARMNPRARRHLASRKNVESLLVFR